MRALQYIRYLHVFRAFVERNVGDDLELVVFFVVGVFVVIVVNSSLSSSVKYMHTTSL